MTKKIFYIKYNNVAKVKNSPIFAVVNKKETIVLQKLTAGIFLALFICITVVKITHHHYPQTISKGWMKGSQVTLSSNCAICDYQIAKDAHHFNGFLFLQQIEQYFPEYSSYNILFVTSVGAISSGRGPPLVAD